MHLRSTNYSKEELERLTNQLRDVGLVGQPSTPTINIHQRRSNSRPLLFASASSQKNIDDNHERAFQIIEHPTMSTKEKVAEFKKLSDISDIKIMKPRSKDNPMTLLGAASTIHDKHPELFDEIMNHHSLIKSIRESKNDPKFRHAGAPLNRLGAKKPIFPRDVPMDYMDQVCKQIDEEKKNPSTPTLFRKQYPHPLRSSAKSQPPSIDQQKANDIHARMVRTIMESEHITPEEKETVRRYSSNSDFFSQGLTMKDGKTMGDIIHQQKTLRSSARPVNESHLAMSHNFYNSFKPCDNEFKKTFELLKNDSVSDSKKLKHLDDAIKNGLNIHQKMSDGSTLLRSSAPGSAVYNKIAGLYRQSFSEFKKKNAEMQKTKASVPEIESVDAYKLKQTQKLHGAINKRNLAKCKEAIKSGACPHLEIDGVTGHTLLEEMNKIPFSRDLNNLFKEQSSTMTKSGIHCFKEMTDEIEEVADKAESDIEDVVEEVLSDIEDAGEEVKDAVEKLFNSKGCSKKSRKSKSSSSRDRDSEYM